jgi:dTDP-4-amino-4,6-dideoxygalactose transaminase
VREPQFLKGEASPWYYEVQELSTNSHLTEFQAALGLSQLSRLEGWIDKRRKLVRRYRMHLGSFPNIRLFDSSFDERTAYHLMVVQVDFEACRTTRTQVMEALKAQGIGSQYHYIPLYRHPCYQHQMGSIEEYFPEMEAYYRTALSLPLFADLSLEDVDRICEAFTRLLA